MKILFVASEMEPIAKVGGLADVLGVLPLRLKKLGCDVRVVVPFYRQVREYIERHKMRTKEVGDEIITCIDWLPFRGNITELRVDGVIIYLLGNDNLYDREYIYSTPKGDYEDNDRRFGFLSLGALEIAKSMKFKPDVIHCHDWQTALIPICLKWRKHLKGDPFFKDSKIVFTIHNLAYQGQFDRDVLESFGLPWFLFTPQGIEFYGRANLLKGAIAYSDSVTTVSKTYVEEIKTPKYGCGLDGILRSISNNSNNLVGILNGIDFNEWNPDTDDAVYFKYSIDKLDNKWRNKTSLRKELGIGTKEDQPLLGMVSRLTEQKGIDLIVESLPQIFDLDFQVVILGDGERKFSRMLSGARKRYKKNLSFIQGFDDTMARKIYAGSDLFLMPSRYEPCGTGQMIALRYGTIPVVRGTGGLLDTVIDHSASKKKGNGFIFHEFSKVSFLDALIRAVSVFENKNEWNQLIRRAMKMDFSWRRSSESYFELYKSVTRIDRKIKNGF